MPPTQEALQAPTWPTATPPTRAEPEAPIPPWDRMPTPAATAAATWLSAAEPRPAAEGTRTPRWEQMQRPPELILLRLVKAQPRASSTLPPSAAELPSRAPISKSLAPTPTPTPCQD